MVSKVCNLMIPKIIFDSTVRTDVLLHNRFAMGYSTWSHLAREYTVCPSRKKEKKGKNGAKNSSKLTEIFKNDPKMTKTAPVK
jgi:hypothetical protein